MEMVGSTLAGMSMQDSECRSGFLVLLVAASLVGGAALAMSGCGGGGETDGGERSAAGEDAGGGERVGEAGLSRRIESAGVALTIPAGWEMRAPSRAMRSAEFVVPAPDDASVGEPAVGTVFTTIGGGVDENLARWEAQFVDPETREVSVDRRTVDGRLVGVFAGSGTFDAGRMLGSTGPREGFMVLGLIAETDSDKPIVVKITGPASVLSSEAARDGFDRLVSSVEGAS